MTNWQRKVWPLVVALAACGGGEVANEGHGPLLDDEGQAMPDARVAGVDDPVADVSGVRLASEAQAADLERALGDAVLVAEARCCGEEEVGAAVLLVYAAQAAWDLPDSTPVLVRGTDRRAAAAVARRLLREGYGPVWVVG